QSSTEVFNPDIINPIEDLRCDANTAIEWYLELGQKLYKELLDEGVAKECARMILPMSSKTTIHVSGTFRDLLAFLNVRCEEHSQKEVKDIATKIGEELEKALPNIMKNIDWRNGLFM
ncbi:MAG: FAD-dependent thymidylate synthase, partial [Senegalia sp. (in: firmicutes)]